MATPAEVQAQIDAGATGRVANIQNFVIAGLYNNIYAVGVTSPYAGRSRWTQTLASGNAATQAAAVLANLVAYR